MPELPEVETIRGELDELLKGKNLLGFQNPSGYSLRKSFHWPQKKLKVQKVYRWGKKLFIGFNKGSHLDVSLGMTGSFRRDKRYSFKSHDHIVFKLSDQSSLVYNDPRRFGWIQYNSHAPSLRGWDPILSPEEGKEQLVKCMKSSRKDLYSFLLDQSHIVGLGNIYVQEALFRAGAHPFKRSYKTSYKNLYSILDKVQEILKEALSYRGTTIINYKSVTGDSGGFQSRLKVYGKSSKDKCLKCLKPLKKVKKARSVTYCRFCQK